MAEYRSIHTRIWTDAWFSDLPPRAKLLFIYLFSNHRASVSGMYELPSKYMAFDTGLGIEEVNEFLEIFEAAKKAYYRDGVVWVVNLRKYNETSSPKVASRIEKDLEEIPDCELKRIYYEYYKMFPGRAENGGTILPDYDDDERLEPVQMAPPATTEESRLEGMYTAVTGNIALPSTKREDALAALRVLAHDRTEAEVFAYLSPYWEEWKKRGYARSNLAWLIDWSVSGQIPEKRTNGSNTAETSPRTAAERRRADLERVKERYSDG